MKLIKTNKVGLVLSGGGAKGAYQAGVMKALQELNIPVDMIAGASIGALNGAVLASAPDIDTGIDNLQELWEILPTIEPIKLDVTTKNGFISEKLGITNSKYRRLIYITLLISSGLRFSTPVGWLSTLATHVFSSSEIKSLFSDKALQDMMEKFLDLDNLQNSIPLYVSMFEQKPNGSAFKDFASAIVDGVKTELLGIENSHSDFRHIQSLSVDEQKDVILASASLPLLFTAYKDNNGNRYTDGGQGGLIKSQGNTPITPLLEAGCKHIIITHLSEGSLWARHDFPDTTVIEIRPSIEMGGLKAMLDFSEERVRQLIKVGYQDTMDSITKVQKSLVGLQNLRQSSAELVNSLADTSSLDNLSNAMDRLRRAKK